MTQPFHKNLIDLRILRFENENFNETVDLITNIKISHKDYNNITKNIFIFMEVSFQLILFQYK